jgi:hypothetical protein
MCENLALTASMYRSPSNHERLVHFVDDRWRVIADEDADRTACAGFSLRFVQLSNAPGVCGKELLFRVFAKVFRMLLNAATTLPPPREMIPSPRGLVRLSS